MINSTSPGIGCESHNSNIAVIGLGRVGQLVCRYLLKNGTYVYAYDDNHNIFDSKEIRELRKNPNFIIMNKIPARLKTKKIRFAISSPGLPEKSKIIQLLRKNSIPVIDEIEFTQSKVTKPIIAITGTNGKSTTTALLGRMLYTDNKNCFWGGNLAPGLPFATTLFQETKDFYVIEMSSFQLERCINFHPNIAILLNITQDHLDRHVSLAEYRDIKFKIFDNQNRADYAVINYEDKIIMDKHNIIKSKLYYFSNQRKVKGTYVRENQIYFDNEKICSLNVVRLLGTHFINSILPAVCAAKLVGVKNSSIVSALRTFNGLEHRLEFVAEYNDVVYINNSMCTNPAAGAATLKSFKKPVILIAGGKEKNLEADDYIREITTKVKHVELIGDNCRRLARQLKSLGYMNFRLAESLKDAVVNAKQIAKFGDVILFSPGFASFDSFTNFQERGKAFKEIVYGIK